MYVGIIMGGDAVMVVGVVDYLLLLLLRCNRCNCSNRVGLD
jgi:hypothetical protein